MSVSASGDGPYSGYDGSFSYDTTLLKLNSISQGNYPASSNFKSDGANFLDYLANIPNGGVLVTASFTCLAAGSSTIACSLGDIGDINGTSITVSGASTPITITTPVPKSSNANLASLAISPGTLSPAFSAATLNYSTTVGQDQTKITVSASPADSKSKVALNGVQKSLATGKNTVKITVTAEDGSTKVYSLVVNRTSGPTPTPAPTAAPLPLMTYNGSDYSILTAGEADAVPEGFTAGTATYQGVAIPVLQKTLGDAVDASQVTIVLLASDTGNAYFVYDAATQTIYPYLTVSSAVQSFQILGAAAATAAPAGYEPFDFMMLTTPVSAYRLISDPTNVQILLNLMDANGIQGLYYYDTQTGMLMPYRGAVVLISTTPTPVDSSTPTPETVTATVAPNPQTPVNPGSLTFQSLRDVSNPVVLLVYFLALLCLGLLISTIVLIVSRGKANGYEYVYEDADADDEDIAPASAEPFRAPQVPEFFREYGQTGEPTIRNPIQKSTVDEDLVVLDFPEFPQKNSLNAENRTVTENQMDYNGDADKRLPENAQEQEQKSETGSAGMSDNELPSQEAHVPNIPQRHIPVMLQRDLASEKKASNPVAFSDPDADPDND